MHQRDRSTQGTRHRMPLLVTPLIVRPNAPLQCLELREQLLVRLDAQAGRNGVHQSREQVANLGVDVFLGTRWRRERPVREWPLCGGGRRRLWRGRRHVRRQSCHAAAAFIQRCYRSISIMGLSEMESETTFL